VSGDSRRRAAIGGRPRGCGKIPSPRDCCKSIVRWGGGRPPFSPQDINSPGKLADEKGDGPPVTAPLAHPMVAETGAGVAKAASRATETGVSALLGRFS
jgi:hypothetical protein